MSFYVRVEGFDQLVRTYQRAAGVVNSITQQYLQEKGDMVLNLYRGAVPVVTGELRSSIYGTMQGSNRFVGGAHAPYANAIEAMNYCAKHGGPHHHLRDALNIVIAQMRNGAELAERLRTLLGF